MYQPPHFRSDDPATAALVMREHPFASLVSVGDDGIPFVTHLPLHLDEAEGRFTLWGHCAKPNPHWRLLEARPRALVTFMGPHAYQSPRIYEDKLRVPSWNYIAVHCSVEARLVQDAGEKDGLLKKLIGDHEAPFAQQWREFPEDLAGKMLAGIVGFELRVVEWTCKIKLNQHRPESHAALKAGYLSGSADERGLATWMDRIGLKG